MSATMNKANSARPGLRAQAIKRWRQFAPRERMFIGLGGAALGVLVLWLLAVQPALRTAREAPAQIDRLDVQLQQMQRLAAESKGLRAAPPVSPAQAQAALKASTDRLGDKARLAITGDRATLTVTSVSVEALRGWLAEVRSAARARAIDVQLSRGPQGLTGVVIVTLGGNS